MVGLLRDGSPAKEGRVLATLVASNEAVSYLKVKKISERLEIGEQNESVKRNSSLDRGMYRKPKLHHSDSRSQLSSDFQYSKIYVKSGDNQEINKIVDNLNMVKNTIRHILSNRIDMRRVPEILFKEDNVMEKGLNVLKILDEIRENKNSKNIISIDTND